MRGDRTGRARPADTRALARGMLLSLAVLHSPRDVSVTVLTAPGSESDWGWLRWLPHVRQPDSARCLVRVGNDETSIGLRLDELREALESAATRTGAGWPQRHQGTVDIVVLDGSYRLRLGFNRRSAAERGACRRNLLPVPGRRGWPSCRRNAGRGSFRLADHHGTAVARCSGQDTSCRCHGGRRSHRPCARRRPGRWPRSGRLMQGQRRDAPADGGPVPGRGRAGAARAAADPGGLGQRRPDHLGIARLPGGRPLLPRPRPGAASAAWRATTGSGKSELLQTLVASLAAANRPDAMNFVLIDYKGGAAFRALSHCRTPSGMLTDLDEFLVDRALTSLRAELQRRKAVLAKRARQHPRVLGRAAAMPAPTRCPAWSSWSMSSRRWPNSCPDQLRSLVDIGTQGRSLGIHLVLATQRRPGSSPRTCAPT